MTGTQTTGFAEMFDQLAQDIAEISESKGFWDIPGMGENGLIPAKIALMHSELTEALDVHRKPYEDDPEGASEYTGMTPQQEEDFSEELADCVIRILDTIGYYGMGDTFGRILIAKIEKNRDRPFKHGKRY